MKDHKKSGAQPPPKQQSIRQICFEAFSRGERPMDVVRRLGFKKSTVLTYHRQFRVSNRPAPLRQSFEFWLVTEEVIDRLSRKTRVPGELLWGGYGQSLDYFNECIDTVPLNRTMAIEKRAAQKLVYLQLHMLIGDILKSSPYAVVQVLRCQGLKTKPFSLRMRHLQSQKLLCPFDRNKETAAQQWASMVLTMTASVLAYCMALGASPTTTLVLLKRWGIDLQYFRPRITKPPRGQA